MSAEQAQTLLPRPRRVFISWSGPRSKAVAALLRKWLPRFLNSHSVEGWMSDRDIPSGARWSHLLSKSLEDSELAIICLTPYNLVAPWLHFEAGAIAKRVTESSVFPLLIDVETSELPGPLNQFQAVKADKEGIRSLMRSLDSLLNEQGGGGTDRVRSDFDFFYDLLWSAWELEFEEALNSKDPEQVDLKSSRTVDISSDKRWAFGYLQQDSSSFADLLEEKPEPVYLYEARRVGVGHGFAILECAIDPSGYAEVTRTIQVEAYSPVDSLDTFLLFPEGQKKAIGEGNLNIKHLSSLESGRTIEPKLRSDDGYRQEYEIIFSPPLKPGEKTGYKMVEQSALPTFDLKGAEEFVGWSVSRPTRRLEISVILPNDFNLGKVWPEVRRSPQSGFPSAPMLKSEEARLKLLRGTLLNGKTKLTMEVEYPMIGLQYLIGWAPE